MLVSLRKIAEMFPLVFPLTATFFEKWEQEILNISAVLHSIVPGVPTVPTFR
jgi:vacuolar-type H+-ATPase subunit C/Vma6